MTGSSSDPQPTVTAVEALVRSIEAKEGQEHGSGVGADATPSDDAGPDPWNAIAPDTGTRVVTREPPAPPLWTQLRLDAEADLPPVSAPLPIGPTRPPASGWAWSPTARGPLPGLIDRQLWEALITEEAIRQRRYERPTAVVLAELEGLPEMVARMGPAAMNRLVPPCAEILVSLVRDSDRVARLTNARFGVLLLETDGDGAAGFAGRVAVAAERWLAGGSWPVRVVLGWAAPTSSDGLRSVLHDAEAHLERRRG